MDPKTQWEGIYATRDSTQVSWYAPHVETSLELLDSLGLRHDARLLDVGGGASTLVDDWLARGFRDVTVLDLSEQALAIARSRLGARAGEARWIAGDILTADLGPGRFDLWHDRAVLHFLTADAQRARYRERVGEALAPGGHVVLSVFADDGPLKCSGIEIRRSSEADLEALLGPEFRTVSSRRSIHRTPSGTEQRFVHLVSLRLAG